MKNIGLYLHIPFCKSKCPYCDFYSFSGKDTQKDEYTKVLKHRILSSISTLQRKGDTLYIGGGTPSVLGAENLKSLVDTCKKDFLTEDAEITVECNPYGLNKDFFKILHDCGVNRISLGLQSAVDSERRILGRLSDRNQVENAVKIAQQVGFENITLDIMLGIPNQTEKSLNETLDFCISLGVPHISAYMLKLEENTHFYKNQ
ncbi:MAG: radical SAM protein, partial [Clostridia bacterium]|nr:radical SAM protein [Clostridia bacterium]